MLSKASVLVLLLIHLMMVFNVGSIVNFVKNIVKNVIKRRERRVEATNENSKK